MVPKFNVDSSLSQNGSTTVLHNVILVQNHYILMGTTEYRGMLQIKVHGALTIALQDHDHTVSYLNIWIMEL